jgi:hypothetical protein
MCGLHCPPRSPKLLENERPVLLRRKIVLLMPYNHSS